MRSRSSALTPVGLIDRWRNGVPKVPFTKKELIDLQQSIEKQKLTTSSRLARRLTTLDAVFIGLGSMIGAGIFSAASPAAAAAGTGLLMSVLIAGGVALLNAITMAQLAAIYPESGGTYVYGRRRLGRAWGLLAGWAFVIGKLASCTAMALTLAFYATPQYARPIAVGAVLVAMLINYLGIRKTAQATKVIVGAVLTVLATVCAAALTGGGANTERLQLQFSDLSFPGILQAAGIMFFAFAGYARIATLGEEVIEASKTIPKAILASLGITLFIYITVISTAVLCIDLGNLAQPQAPLAQAVESGAYAWLAPIVRVGGCIASFGVLLSLMAGISRTIFAMASSQDLPPWFSAVHPVHRIPHRAELLVGFIVAGFVTLTDLRSAIGFSSFAILIYYSIANLAAWSLRPEERRWPRWMSGARLVLCLAIAFSLPFIAIMAGVAFFTLGLAVYGWKQWGA